ncbi:hypothetical protein Trydic_g10805 [Trypoxylus dichotomus]
MVRAAKAKALRTIKGVNLRDQIRIKMTKEDLEIHSTVYEGKTTILEEPRLQNDRRPMVKSYRIYETSIQVSRSKLLLEEAIQLEVWVQSY